MDMAVLNHEQRFIDIDASPCSIQFVVPRDPFSVDVQTTDQHEVKGPGHDDDDTYSPGDELLPLSSVVFMYDADEERRREHAIHADHVHDEETRYVHH